MIRLKLTEAERAAVRALRRDRDLAPAERDRVELVLLSDAGWSAPRVARQLGKDRTWTAAQLAQALAEEGIALSARQTRKDLGAMGARRRRVQRTVRRKQDPAAVEQAERVLASLKKRPPRGASPSAPSTSAASPRAS